MRASKKVKGAVLLTAGAALMLGAPTVYADDIESSNNSGLLGGLQLLNGTEINLPITVGGVGVLGVGKGDATVKAGNKSKSNGNGSNDTKAVSKNNSGILGGLQVGNGLAVNAPVTVCGVGVLLAKGSGDCDVKAGNGGGDTKAVSKNNSGIGGGLQALNGADVNAPITVCGLGVLGRGAADCDVKAGNGGKGSGGGNTITSKNNDGLLGGLQLLNGADVNAPVTVCGLAVLGTARGDCDVEAGNDRDGDIRGVKKDRDRDRDGRDRNGSVRGAVLPKTGAAGLAVLPFGLALVAGGVALRRRIGVEA